MKVHSIGLGLVAMAVSASSAFAGPVVNKADLTVNITAPAGIYVGQPGQYEVRVANTGTKDASTVSLTIALPRTNTSPSVSVLGNLGAFDGRCARSGTNLVCALGTLRKGRSIPVRFTIELPQSSAPLVVGASVTTPSAERSTTNNTDSDTAYLLHPLQPVSVGDTSHNEHCTGRNLTSFFECELYPSSIASHDIEYQADGLLAFVGAPASYWGTWSQSAGGDRLLLEYYDGASNEATFDGYAVGDGCFEGLTTFHPASVYVAPYRVCLQ